MRSDHRMLLQPVAVVAFVLALAAPAGAADLIPDEGCGYGCDGRAAGYAFAERNNITDPYDCEGHGSAFFAGCSNFVEQRQANQPWGAPVPGNQYAQPYGGQSYGGQPYPVPPSDGGGNYAAPGQGQGYGSDEQQQYDEPAEQGDGAPQPY
jgi:hypothetical protein